LQGLLESGHDLVVAEAGSVALVEGFAGLLKNFIELALSLTAKRNHENEQSGTHI
jgi:hypothetical protein